MAEPNGDIQIQLRNVRAEIILIKAFCQAKKKGRSHALSRVDDDTFGSKVGKLVWKRIRALNVNKKLPFRGAWDIIVSDPIISRKDAVVDILTKFDDTQVSGTVKFINEVIDTLHFFKAKRVAFEAIQSSYNGLAEAKNVDEISESLVPVITQSRCLSDISTSKYFQRIDNMNIGNFLQDRKDNAGKDFLARTLWPSFDAVNTGFSFGSLITCASTTGGGKSTVIALNLLLNFAMQGLQVSNISLEMSMPQITERIAANISGIPLHKIRSFNLTDEEKQHLANASLMLAKMVGGRGGSYYTLCPENKDITIDEALVLAYEKTPHVILIDYINLLKMDSSKQVHESLSDIGRTAKNFAMSHNCIVVLLAQLNDSERTKYGTAIEEHCVIGDSLIDTENGLMQIEDYLPKNDVNKIVAECDLTVTTADGQRKAKRWYKKGERDCIAIATENKNFQVTGSVTTKVLVLNPDMSMDWKPLNKITKDDYIAIKRDSYCWGKNVIFEKTFDGANLKYKMPYVSPKKMTPALAKVCGYLVAEGHIKNAVVSFCNGQEDIGNHYALLFNALFNAEKKSIWNGKARAYYTKIEARVVADFLEYIGLKGDARSKEIPWSVMQSSKKCNAAFLQGYFEGDINKEDYTAHTYSKKLAKQLQATLLKFGIVAKIFDKEDSYGRQDKTKSNKYSVLAIQGTDRKLFKERIGLKFYDLRDVGEASLKDSIPYLKGVLASYKVGNNSYKTECGNTKLLKLKSYLGKCVNYAKTNKPEFLETLSEHFPMLHEKVELLNKTNYYWDKVDVIKHERHMVYDFTVEPGEHPVLGQGSFIANGVIVHNSDNVLIWSYPANTRPGYIKVKQTKARNQVPFDFYLVEDFGCMRVFDFLDTVGLATLLSRSSTQAYIPKTTNYFGLRRFQEIQEVMDLDSIGIMKHTFKEDINWGDFLSQAVPAPNAPDAVSIIDMVREIIFIIAMYEPGMAQAYVHKMKNDKLLSPYSDYVNDLDLPLFAKKQLGLIADTDKVDFSEKEKMLALIEQDLLELSQDVYVEADKAIEMYRKDDNPVERREVYDSTYEQVESRNDPEKLLRKKNKQKLMVDPEENESKWVDINKGYKFHQGLRVATTVSHVTENSNPFGELDHDDTVPEVVMDTKTSEKVFNNYWKKLAKETPPSLDFMRETLLQTGSLPKPSFLVGFDESYINDYEASIDILGGYVQKRVERVTDNLPRLICENMPESKEDRVARYVAKTVNKIAKRRIVVDDNYPDISILTSKIVSKSFYDADKVDVEPILKKLSKLENYKEPLLPLKNKILCFCEKGNIDKIHSSKSSDVRMSPFITLYKKPEYIESITNENYRFVDIGFLALVLKLGKLLNNEEYENKQVINRSIVWSLVNKEYRSNITILKHISRQIAIIQA